MKLSITGSQYLNYLLPNRRHSVVHVLEVAPGTPLLILFQSIAMNFVYTVWYGILVKRRSLDGWGDTSIRLTFQLEAAYFKVTHSHFP